LTVQKGGQEEKCEWENWDSTSWGCTHDGGDAYVWRHNETSFEKGTENVTIDNGANGDFRFTLQHWPSSLDLLYEDDHKIYSTMSIAINDGEPHKFNLPENNGEDTNLLDGSINPAYNGTTHVRVSCNSDCHCDITEEVPTLCELNAELSFPPFKDDYYGYVSDALSISKDGEGSDCGYYSPSPEWGCFSSGDAYIYDQLDDPNYYDSNSTQRINIVDAADSDFIFTVESSYYYGHYFSTYYDNTHKYKSLLDIAVGDKAEVFKHNKADGWELGDSSIMQVLVVCDSACLCTMQKLSD